MELVASLEGEMQENVKQYALMLENVNLACVIRDSRWSIQYANEFFLRSTGWSLEEIYGKSWIDLFVPDEHKQMVTSNHARISEGKAKVPSYEVFPIRTRDGDVRTFHWNYSIMKDSQGRFLGINSIGKPVEPTISPQEGEKETTEEKTIGSYILGKDIGSVSGQGLVRLAVHKVTKEIVAIKTLRKSQMNAQELERAQREIRIMSTLKELKNPFIVKLIESHETPAYIHIVEEYVSGGELVSLIEREGKLTERYTKRLFKQLLSAVECCHRHSIVHRDLKLQNILIDEQGNLKVIDFGLSNYTAVGVFRSTFCGTPAFAPPEILLGTEYEGPEVDIWSLGIVLYAMLQGDFPFKSIGDIIKGKYAEPEHASPECRDLIKRMLVKMEDRITMEKVLSHPWLMGEEISRSASSFEPLLKRRRSMTSE